MESKTVGLSFEKDLIPEGIAIDPKSKKVYLNSLRHNKIVRCNLDGSEAEDFITANQYGYLSGFGMTIKGDTLFALGNTLPKVNNKSILLLLDVTSGDLIESHSIVNSEFIYLNDLALGSKDKLFITNSENNELYTLNNSSGELEVFFSSDEIKHPNGIAISADERFLYLASYTTGIRILEIETLKLVNSPNDHKGIDGMKCLDNSLFAIVNSRRDTSQNGLYQFYLSDEGSKIVKKEKLLDWQNPSDIPTTFDSYENNLYFVHDSQMDNFNQETNEIIDQSKLETYLLTELIWDKN